MKSAIQSCPNCGSDLPLLKKREVCGFCGVALRQTETGLELRDTVPPIVLSSEENAVRAAARDVKGEVPNG